MMKYVLLSFDIEEFDVPEEYGAVIPEDQKFDVSRKGTEALLKVLEQTGAKATFFTTVSFVRKYPELVMRMQSCGEIASHGMQHSGFAITDLRESRENLAALCGREVLHFRMPRLAKVGENDLIQAGYVSDASLNPIWLPGRYCNLSAPVRPFRKDSGLIEIPVSVTAFGRFPLFWLSFKNLPEKQYASFVRGSLRKHDFFSLYTHPWEYAEEAAESRWKLPGYLVRHAGQDQCGRLERLIRMLQKEADFVTFSEYIKKEWKHE